MAAKLQNKSQYIFNNTELFLMSFMDFFLFFRVSAKTFL